MSDQENWRILVISDDASSLEMLQTTLHRAGFRTLVTVDGEAGLRLARAEQPDLVIVDTLLLGLDSVQVCESLRADPACKDILCVLLVDVYPTATDLPRGWAASGEQAGPAHLLLPKPVDPKHLVRQINTLLQAEGISQKPIGPVVLVVDYQEDDRAGLIETLREAGYKASGTGSAEEGRLLIEARCPALVMVAVGFPEGQGLELLEVARQNYPQMSCVAIVDSGQQELAQAALRLGVEGLLIKPLEPWYVAPLVEGCLERKRLRELSKRLAAQLREAHFRLVEQQQALRGQNEELARVNERLREINVIRENLANMIVHDLKNPLGVLLGTVELVRLELGEHLSFEQQEILTTAKASGQQMLTLVNSILEVQRLEEGKMPISPEAVVLDVVLRSSLSYAHPLVKVKGLQLEQDIPEGLPRVRADPILLRRVFDNLLNNAIKYTPGQGTITVKAEVQNDELVVYVHDTGPGIPAGLQESIFEKFIQVEVRQVGDRAGVGLGLTFCKLAAEGQGGRIWVESEEGSGSTFCLALPLWKEAEPGDK
jgi:signal transduction histidine kinase